MSNDIATPVDDNTRRYYLDVMGIQCWELLDSESEQESAESGSIATAALQLETDVQQCARCVLHKTRKQAIVGRGNVSAELMFVLVSPDSNDDSSARICSGEADKLFTKMLAAINIPVDNVYISSLLKCSVPAEHTITTTELHHCKDFLIRQIQLVQPKLLVVLGETAAQCLLQKNLSLDELRGHVNTATDETLFESVPLFVSYSPHELIMQPADKRKAWQDLQQIQKIIASR